MLNRLCIQNYALIDTLDIDFDAQLNIITGETGAGKSIIMGALSLILGQRIESKYFFNQQKKCVIEGLFAIENYPLKSFFDDNDLDYATLTSLRREISTDGKSRAFINDTPVNLSLLKKLGELLIDIHSQHATLEINNEAFQILVLDIIANQQTLVSQYKVAFGNLKKLQNSAKELKERLAKQNDDKELFSYQLNELQQAHLQVHEQETLEEEQQILSHAEQIKSNLISVCGLLQDNEQAVLNQIKHALNTLQNTSHYSSESKQQHTRLETCFIEIKDIVTEIERLQEQTQLNQERLGWVSERLSTIYQLQKKHKVTSISELLEVQKRIEEQQAKSASLDEELDLIQKQIQQDTEKLYLITSEIHNNRQRVIPEVEEKIINLLKEVSMPDAILKIENKALELKWDNLDDNGIDNIQFMFSANKGQTPMPLQKVASGGELSRLMLSIKSIIAKNTQLPTIIFDEIDTGISGEVAQRVGSNIANLSSFMQVIAITHLPQIASKGNTHFFVYKDTREDNTRSQIRKLTPEERIQELAVMLSGINPNHHAIENAKQLLNLS